MAHYENLNIDAGTASITALALVLHLISGLGKAGVISDAIGQEVLQNAVNAVREEQREEARALVRGVIPGAQV